AAAPRGAGPGHGGQERRPAARTRSRRRAARGAAAAGHAAHAQPARGRRAARRAARRDPERNAPRGRAAAQHHGLFRPALGHAQGRAPARQRHGRSSARRRPHDRITGPTDRHAQYPWHGLHVVGRPGGPAAAVRRRARGGPAGQGLPGRGAAPRRPPAGRLGPRPHPSFPRLVVRPVRPYGAAPQECNESVQCAVGLSDFPCAVMNASTLPDVEIARFNMVEQQIRPWNVLDSKVLDALSAVRREQFVPPALRALAFSDLELPLQINAVDTRQVMLAPKVEARLAQELQLTPTDCVLEIGSGSGYQAALLAHLAQQVTSVEIDSRLVAFAQQNLQLNNVTNVKVETGDGRNGWGTTEY